jgi:hypothetical protein
MIREKQQQREANNQTRQMKNFSVSTNEEVELPQTTTMIVCVAGWNLTDHNLNLSEYSLKEFVE